MCQQEVQNFSKAEHKLKPTYRIKKVLKMLFKKQQQKMHNLPMQQQKFQLPNQQQHQQQQQLRMAFSLESIESWENLRNAQVEEQFYEEIDDNYMNEKLANMTVAETEEEQDIYVPVRFARTTAGTFFWTTNLQPAFVTNMPAADEDLVQPAYCYSNSQYPLMQFQDRWAQA